MLIVLILNWFPALTPTMPRVYSDGRMKRAVLSWTRRMYERRMVALLCGGCVNYFQTFRKFAADLPHGMNHYCWFSG